MRGHGQLHRRDQWKCAYCSTRLLGPDFEDESDDAVAIAYAEHGHRVDDRDDAGPMGAGFAPAASAAWPVLRCRATRRMVIVGMAREMDLLVRAAVTGTGCCGDHLVGRARTARALTFVRAFCSCLNYVSEDRVSQIARGRAGVWNLGNRAGDPACAKSYACLPVAIPSCGDTGLYTSEVSSERFELEELIAHLSDDQIPGVLADLRRRVVPLNQDRTWPPEFFGVLASAANGRTDNARRVDEVLAEGFGSPRS